MKTDIAIIGGGPAGLQAALTIGRIHRTAMLFDDGAYRNATATHMHNVIANDGTPPEEFRATARRQLAAYDSVTLRTDRILDVEAVGGTFRLTSACGDVIDANAVILATGVRDELPAISGLDGLWGDLVAACPFCHGHELTGRRVGIVGAARAAHLVSLLGPIAGDLVVFAHDGEAPEGLPSGVTVLPGPVAAVRRAGDGVEVRLEDGTVESVASLFVGTTLHQRAPFAAQLGLERNPSGCVRIDELGRTSRPGVFAAGDLAHLPAFPMPMSAVILAAAAGQVAASAAIAMPRATTPGSGRGTAPRR